MNALAMGAGMGGFYAAEEDSMDEGSGIEKDLRNQLRVIRRIQRALEHLPPEQRLKLLVALVTSYEAVEKQ